MDEGLTVQPNYSTTKEKRSPFFFSSLKNGYMYCRVGDEWSITRDDERKRKSKERKELRERLKWGKRSQKINAAPAAYGYIQYVMIDRFGEEMLWAVKNYKAKEIRNLYDPQNENFSPISSPYEPMFDEEDGASYLFDDPELQMQRKHFDDWCYETSLSLWEEQVYQEFYRSLTELKQLSVAVMDENRRHVFAEDHYNEIAKNKNVEEFLHQAKDLLDDMRTWTNELKAKIRTEIKTLDSGAVFLVSRSFLAAPRTSSRSRRSPVRSAAKAGDDGGGDDPDGPGEPPRPVLTVPSLSTSPTLTTPQRNNSTLSRTPHPCRWSVLGRWAA